MENHTRRGFTLIETVVAMAVSSVLLLALGSAVLVASRAIPSGNEPVISEGEIQRGVALMTADIEQALGVTYAAGVLTLTVPDRDGDDTPDSVVYAWNGGDKMITRARNGGNAETLIGPVTYGNVVITQDSTRLTSVLVVLVISGASPPDRVINARLLNMPEK